VVTCRLVPREVRCMVPYTTCRMEQYIVKYQVCRKIPVCIPECVCPHPYLAPRTSHAPPPLPE
jgi:hypothetical protein